jgi:hypothetical protein
MRSKRGGQGPVGTKGVAAVAVLLAMAPGLIGGCVNAASPSEAPTAGPTASPSALPSPAPEQGQASFQIEWEQSFGYPATARPVGQLNLTGLIAGESGFVAFGAVTLGAKDDAAQARSSANYDISAGVWTSPDGQTWRQAQDPALAGARIRAAGASPTGGIVLAGFAPPSSGTDWSVGVWTSQDEVHWRASRFAAAINVVAVATNDRCIVASAFDESGNGIWTSCDGKTWKATYPLGTTKVVDILMSTPSGFVAIGEWKEAGQRHLMAAISKDGSSWQDASVVGDDLLTTNPHLVSTPSGLLVAAGSPVDAGRSVLWRSSADGQTWTHEETSGSLTGANVGEWTACTVGVVIVGGSRAGGATTWTSADGMTWFAQAVTPKPGFVDSIAARGDKVVALMTSGFQHTIWVGQIAPAGPKPT